MGRQEPEKNMAFTQTPSALPSAQRMPPPTDAAGYRDSVGGIMAGYAGYIPGQPFHNSEAMVGQVPKFQPVGKPLGQGAQGKPSRDQGWFPSASEPHGRAVHRAQAGGVKVGYTGHVPRARQVDGACALGCVPPFRPAGRPYEQTTARRSASAPRMRPTSSAPVYGGRRGLLPPDRNLVAAPPADGSQTARRAASPQQGSKAASGPSGDEAGGARSSSQTARGAEGCSTARSVSSSVSASMSAASGDRTSYYAPRGRADRTAVLDNDSRYAKVGAIAREKVAIRTDRWIAENNPYMTSSQMGIRHDAATPRPTKPVSAAGYKVGYRGHVPGAKFDLGCSPYSEQ